MKVVAEEGSFGYCNITGLIKGHCRAEVCCVLDAALFCSTDIFISLSLLIIIIVQNNWRGESR